MPYRSSYSRASQRPSYSRPVYYRRATGAAVARKPRATAAPRKAKTTAPRMTALGSGLRTAGAALGTAFGGPVGGVLGHFAGAGLSKIIGSGDYVVMAPNQSNPGGVDQTSLSRDQLPMFDYDVDGVVITHREYITDIYSSNTAGAFNVESFPINPGMRQTFPWLSDLVGNSYQQYKFESLVFCFKTFSADALNSTNTALGTVVSCVNYDSSDVPYTSRAQMENTDWAVSTKPSESVLIPVECRSSTQSQNNYYIRTGAPPAQSDIKTYDLGRLSIATLNFQGTNVNAGSLYVTYKVRLMKPIQLRPLALALNAQISAVNPGTSVNGTHPLGTSQNVLFDNIGVSVNGSAINFPVLPVDSLFQFIYTAAGAQTNTGVLAGTIAPQPNTGWAPAPILDSGIDTGYMMPDVTVSGDRVMSMATYKYVGTTDNATPQMLIGYGGAIYPNSLTTADIQIIQLNSNQL